jgi:hypothetical protein
MRRILCLLLVGCTSSSSAAEPPPSGADHDAVDRSALILFSVEAAVVAADTAFDFGDTIDPKATPEQNVARVRGHASAPTCAVVSATTDTVTVDWGAKCVVGAETMSGTMTVKITSAGIAVTYANVSVSGMTAPAAASFATTDGASFTVTFDGGDRVTAADASGAIRIDGTVSGVRIEGLLYLRGQCYAREGKIIAFGTTTYELEMLTPINAQVAVTNANVPFDSVELPPYGSCGVQ